MKITKQGSQEVRTWILFVVGIGITAGMFDRGQDPGPYWTLIIGAFVGLGVIISTGISAIVGSVKSLSDRAREEEVQDNPPQGDRTKS